jgi:hypothetical protein
MRINGIQRLKDIQRRKSYKQLRLVLEKIVTGDLENAMFAIYWLMDTHGAWHSHYNSVCARESLRTVLDDFSLEETARDTSKLLLLVNKEFSHPEHKEKFISIMKREL